MGLRLVLAAAALAAACAARGPPPAAPEHAACRAEFLGLDRRVDAAGVRDGGRHAPPGFPYLRANRFLASFRNEAETSAAFEAWVERLRQEDLDARATELRNLGESGAAALLDRLDRCGRAWAAAELASPDRRGRLRAAVEVPDDYSMLRRVLGLYPLTVPLLNWGIASYNREFLEDYAKPLASLDSPGPVLLWEPEASAPVEPAEAARWLARRDALGIPQLGRREWMQLAAAWQPRWWVETAGDFDRPGTPRPADNGGAGVDASRPVTHFLRAYTRFGGEVLVQLVYVVWFDRRPHEGGFDPYAGALDGLVWRVTLGTDGAPLLYDTIHPCGCYHYYYAARPLPRHAADGFWQEPVLFPQEPPPWPFAIRVQSATHYVRRLVPLERAAGPRRTYALADYAELRALPHGTGTRSLFAEDGLVEGTQRLERLWLWPAGVASPGAMRQWGRHATSFVGRSHFDEPFLLERLFRAQ